MKYAITHPVEDFTLYLQGLPATGAIWTPIASYGRAYDSRDEAEKDANAIRQRGTACKIERCKTCARCSRIMDERPAISRKNGQDICSSCGIEEAMEDFERNERKK